MGVRASAVPEKGSRGTDVLGTKLEEAEKSLPVIGALGLCSPARLHLFCPWSGAFTLPAASSSSSKQRKRGWGQEKTPMVPAITATTGASLRLSRGETAILLCFFKADERQAGRAATVVAIAANA